MSSSPVMNFCFNSNCKHLLHTHRKGWRRTNGEEVKLCDPCASAFEEGKFCETFHINASGWRCCESCGKQIHCGCIVSFHTFVLLDAGGIECTTCARKSFILTPNPAWPPSSLLLPLVSERNKDVSSKNWCHIAGSGLISWRQAPTFFGPSGAQPDLRPRVPMEADVTGGIHRLTSSEIFSVASFDKKKSEVSERLINGILKLDASEKLDICNPGINVSEQDTLHVNVPQQPSILENKTHIPHAMDKYSGEVHTRNGKPSGDTEQQKHSLWRYRPRTSDHELKQISGISKSVITPLFEKKLSVSDTRNSGRLVLPKRCAEAYFPPITHTEGLPLSFQDLKGKEWTFQFRFWYNNKSRMYVLEGVNPCIQSMNLQAGDILTFNWVEPEGKLVMGFRKASCSSPSNQDDGFVNASNGSSTDGDDCAEKFKDPANSWCENRKAECKVKDVLGSKATVSNKGKSSILGSKYKRFKIEKNDPIELELTWEQAQGLLRPPLNRIARVVKIEGAEFEEFEEAPVIGRPTIIAMDSMGENIQWAQCEDCLKWRKVPGDALLSSRWTCSGNSWDPERSSCSVAQELTARQVKKLLSRCNQTVSKNTNAVKQETDSFVDLTGAIQDEGDANPPSAQATIKHPHHRPGCTCIVCIQSPRGECLRHAETCTCNVCVYLKRRLQTPMTRREKKQSEREAELTVHQSSLKQVLDEKNQTCLDIDCSTLNTKFGNGNSGDFNTTRSSLSPFKGHIDLNFQPERDEEQSSGSDFGELTKLIRNTTTETYLRPPQLQFSSSNSHLNC